MRDLARLLPVTAAGILLVSAAGHADTEPPRCTEDHATGAPGTVAPGCIPEPPPARDEWTHVFFMPTGNTLRAGQAAFRGHGVFLYNELAYGLSDHVEVNIGAPIDPLFASAGIRAQLLPRESSLRLLIGGGITKGIKDKEDTRTIRGSGTLAYQSNKSNYHLTIGAIRFLAVASDVNQSTEDITLVLASAGAVIRWGDRSGFFVELSHLLGGREADRTIGALIMGIKRRFSSFEADIGLFMPTDIDESEPIIPFLSMTVPF